MLNLLLFKRNSPANPTAALRAAGERQPNLSQAASGKQVKIAGFGHLTAAQRQHLQAYGLLPGRTIQVLTQRPVTIVLVEQTELAFEAEIARQVFVE